jgi:hypothetical protein
MVSKILEGRQNFGEGGPQLRLESPDFTGKIRRLPNGICVAFTLERP